MAVQIEIKSIATFLECGKIVTDLREHFALLHSQNFVNAPKFLQSEVQ